MDENDLASLAEQVVAAQLDAYNAHDIDAFIACWRADARYFAYPDELLADGIEAIKARHVVRFQDPVLRGELLVRTSVDDLVVDRERVTRTFPSGVGIVDVIAIYEVSDGKIIKAWFKSSAPRLAQPA